MISLTWLVRINRDQRLTREFGSYATQRPHAVSKFLRTSLLYIAARCLLLGRAYADKDVQERIIRKSRLDWTIVRPTILTNGPRMGACRLLVDPRDWTSGFILRAMLPDFLVKQASFDRRRR